MGPRSSDEALWRSLLLLLLLLVPLPFCGDDVGSGLGLFLRYLVMKRYMMVDSQVSPGARQERDQMARQ